MKNMIRFVAVLLLIFAICSSYAFAESESIDYHAIVDMLQYICEYSGYDYCKIEANESGFIIQVAQDGIYLYFLAMIYGMVDRSTWEEYVEINVNAANAISDTITACGIENPNLLFVLLDDRTHDASLLTICNGSVIYDYSYTSIDDI